MNLISVRLPDNLIKKVEREAKKKRINRSQMIRYFLEMGLSSEPQKDNSEITKLREELLLAVGQLGDSMRQLPKFIRPHQHTGNDEDSTAKKDRPTNSHFVEKIEPNRKSRSENVRPNKQEQVGQSDVSTQPSIGWAISAVNKPELALRPRAEATDLTALEEPAMPRESFKTETLKEASSNPSATELIWQGKHDRRKGQVRGLPIGEERRQSIRLARVLAYKKWSAAKLAERLRMSTREVEEAVEGRKDLASLKVEALLSTWEEEMRHMGWQP